MNPKEINDHIIIKEKAGWTFSNLFRSIPLLSYDVFQAKIDRGLKFFEKERTSTIEDCHQWNLWNQQSKKFFSI